MRLVDVDQVIEYLNGTEMATRAKGIYFSALIDNLTDETTIPTVDPVHASGTCYCKECISYGQIDKALSYMCGVTGPDDFCSYGRRKGEL